MRLLGLLVSPKHLAFAALAALGILLLLRRSGKRARLAALAAAFVLLGGVATAAFPSLQRSLGLHPSPMCALVKLIGFAWLKGMFPLPMLAGLAVLVLLSLAGKKLFCGWACPLGALQELLFFVPGIKKLPNLPFCATNGVRVGIFAAFLAALAAFGILLYDHINGFEALHWGWEPASAAVGLAIAVASLFYYRPYCYVVCPIGLLSWLLEPAALLGVRLDRKRCTDCSACRAVGCPAIEPLLAGKTGLLPDCTSCGLCVAACPTGALAFRRASRTASAAALAAVLALLPTPGAAAEPPWPAASRAAGSAYEGPPEELATLRRELLELEAQALELTGKVKELTPRWSPELPAAQAAVLIRERRGLRERLQPILGELEAKKERLSDRRNRWEDAMIRAGANEVLRIGQVPKGAYSLLADAAAVDTFNKRIRGVRSAGLRALQAEEEAYGRYAAARARRLRLIWAASGSTALLVGGLAAFALRCQT